MAVRKRTLASGGRLAGKLITVMVLVFAGIASFQPSEKPTPFTSARAAK